MRLAHLADLHVGFRQFARNAPGTGVNQREADVALALNRAVDDLLEARPDVVAVAGDVFHSVRPPNGAILRLFSELGRLRAGLPKARLLIVAGNHDTPRSSEAGFILPLFQALGAEVALHTPRWVQLDGGTATLVPSASARAIPKPVPGGWNLLVLHGDAPGFGAPGPGEFDPAALEAAGWDYVALGHYHVAAQVGPRCWYSGALEYTSTDPWRERREEGARGLPGKGYLLVDVPGGEPAFRPVGPARPHLDLGPVEAEGMAAADVDGALRDAVGAAAIDGAVVRLRIRSLSRETQRALDHAQLRDWRARALNLRLDVTRPAGQDASPEARGARLRRLDEELDAFLAGRELPPDVDRDALRRLGAEYLSAAADPYTGEPVGEGEG